MADRDDRGGAPDGRVSHDVMPVSATDPIGADDILAQLLCAHQLAARPVVAIDQYHECGQLRGAHPSQIRFEARCGSVSGSPGHRGRALVLTGVARYAGGMKCNTKSSITLPVEELRLVLSLKAKLKVRTNVEVVRRGLRLLQATTDRAELQEAYRRASKAVRAATRKEIEELDHLSGEGLG